jgi:hypothetical protein
MHAHSYTLWLGRTLALSALALGFSGCVNALVGDADACKVGDETYAVGEKYRDDCNSCVCQADGKSECTAIACGAVDASVPDGAGPDPVPGVSCSYLGKPFPVGSRVTTGNGCEACTCEKSGKLSCEDYACPEDGGAPLCFQDKQTYPLGTFIADDGCKCECRGDGKIDCYGCGGTPTDASVDAGPGYPTDASVPTYWCEYNGKKASGTFFSGDACNTCTCRADGQVYCTMNPCLPDGTAGSCQFSGKQIPVGASVSVPGSCETCHCIGNNQTWCDKDACMDPGTPVDASVPGSCDYNGAKYKVGDWFVGDDKCSKCTCVKDGYYECYGEGCMKPIEQCYLGSSNPFQAGQKVTCADGCNTCSCELGGKWSTTDIACAALPPITACPADINVSVFLAQFVYLEGNALAVADSRCVSGKTRDFQLCYEDAAPELSSGGYTLYVYSTGAERSCNASLSERVFSLLPLRDAFVTAHPNWGNKTLLRGNGQNFGYGWQ